MDVSSAQMERACCKFSKSLAGITNEIIHLSYSQVNPQTGTIYTLSTDYEWHLHYWDENLQNSVSKRMEPGVGTWAEKNAQHLALMKKYAVPFKTDYTTHSHSGLSEIVSIASQRPLSSKEVHSMTNLRPLLDYQANQIWLRNDVPPLPLPATKPDAIHPLKLTINQPRFQFGHVILTEKEMSTIRHLLSLKTIKEIAWIHHCSEAAEKKRLETIKHKFGCDNVSRSVLFEILKQHGVIEACLDVYTTSL